MFDSFDEYDDVKRLDIFELLKRYETKLAKWDFIQLMKLDFDLAGEWKLNKNNELKPILNQPYSRGTNYVYAFVAISKIKSRIIRNVKYIGETSDKEGLKRRFDKYSKQKKRIIANFLTENEHRLLIYVKRFETTQTIFNNEKLPVLTNIGVESILIIFFQNS